MQIGGDSTDLILLGMNQRGAASILSSKIKLGGDASAAARMRKHRFLDARRDPQLFAFSRTFCRHFPRGFHLASRQQSKHADLWPQELQQEQSCWATKLAFPQLAAISFACCKRIHRGMSRSRLSQGRECFRIPFQSIPKRAATPSSPTASSSAWNFRARHGCHLLLTSKKQYWRRQSRRLNVINTTFREKIYSRWCCIDRLSWHDFTGLSR